MQFRVGVVVFATMIIGGLLASLNGPLPTGWLPWGQSRYEVGIQMREAPGVGPNTPVRKNGILIGRVTAIEDKDDGVVVQTKIDGDRPLYPEYQPIIRTTVLGDATIDFATRPVPPGTQPVPDGAIFQGQVAPNPFDSLAKLGDLKEEFGAASRSLGNAGDEVAKLAKQVNEAFGDETDEGRVTRLMDSTERAMNQFARTMASFNEIIGDEPMAAQQPVDVQRTNRQPLFNEQQPPAAQPPTNGQPQIEGREMRQRLRQGLAELPDAIREARVTMQDFRVVLKSAEKNFKNLEGLTEPLGQKGDVIAGSIIEAVDGLDTLVEEFTLLVEALNSREGTLGQLIHNPQIYENLNRLMCNANIVLGNINGLMLRLRPIVDDVRVFTDKVSREPGRIVTGALNPPSPIK